MQVEDRQVGDPGHGEVKIRQHAIGLNYIDVYHRTGLYKQPLPMVPGQEAAGEVVALGEGVTDFGVGDRVAYSGAMGAYADERLIPAGRLVSIPDAISFETAAAIMLKGTTAWYLLFETWAVKPGDTILIHAAAGGTGLIAAQWAKALGARVIGTAGSSEKLAMASRHGCDEVINYRTENFAARVRELTGGRGVDVVYDGVGKDTFEASLDCLRPRGLMVSFGNASGPVSIPSLGILAEKGSLYLTRPTSSAYFSGPADLRRAASALFSAVVNGDIQITIGQTFKLAEVAAAHQALESRQTTGSTLLLP
jgi:NADPH2:quinone reductase